MALGVYDGGGEKRKYYDDDEPILDPIYVKFLSIKNGVLTWISAAGFLQRALYFYSNTCARPQVTATMVTLSIRTLKMSDSAARYI